MATNFRILLAALLPIMVLGCSFDDEPDPIPADTVDVKAIAETTPVASADDAADDPAIWLNTKNPAQSFVIGTDKKSGLAVYDLSGAIVFQNQDGRMNNVDVRSDFPIVLEAGDPESAAPTIVVAATNRTNKNIVVYGMDPISGVLTNILAEPIPSNFEDPYGLCLYRSGKTGKLYVYANDKEGNVSQWRLHDNGSGQLLGTLERNWSVGSQTEGCVADDANGVMYIGEEAVGIWRYGAEPGDSSDTRSSVDTTGLGTTSGSRLSADVEGLALYVPPEGEADNGYLVASSQGNFTYVVYDRAPPHAYRGTFQVTDNSEKGVDGSQETDGLDVVAAALSPIYPSGLLVVQDGYNKNPDGSDANQNFKYISWADVAAALNLD